MKKDGDKPSPSPPPGWDKAVRGKYAGRPHRVVIDPVVPAPKPPAVKRGK